jgi:hypothetical protein
MSYPLLLINELRLTSSTWQTKQCINKIIITLIKNPYVIIIITIMRGSISYEYVILTIRVVIIFSLIHYRK